MIVKSADSRMYQRIFSHFNNALFPDANPNPNDPAVDDGDYDSEIERFMGNLSLDQSIEDIAGVEMYDDPDPAPEPIRPSARLNVSVTSQSTRTVASSSKISNNINGNIRISPVEDQAEKTPAPKNPKGQPAGKKKPTKTTEKLAVTDGDANDASAPGRRTRSKLKA